MAGNRLFGTPLTNTERNILVAQLSAEIKIVANQVAADVTSDLNAAISCGNKISAIDTEAKKISANLKKIVEGQLKTKSSMDDLKNKKISASEFMNQARLAIKRDDLLLDTEQKNLIKVQTDLKELISTPLPNPNDSPILSKVTGKLNELKQYVLTVVDEYKNVETTYGKQRDVLIAIENKMKANSQLKQPAQVTTLKKQ